MNNDIFDLDELKKVKPTIQKVSKKKNNDIAIIGMSAKIGLANNIQEYWQSLKDGKTFIRDFPSNRYEDAIDFSIKPIDKGKVIKAGYFEEIDKFDYEFFNISLREAKMMDPNQKIFLEQAWSTLEEAGYGGENIKGSKTGVFVGHSSDLRFDYHTYVYGKDRESYKDISLAGNIKSIIASRISYILDLKGPSIVVDTACSSALVSIHLACQSLKNGECDMAIAGGVKINILPIERGFDDDAGIRSPYDITRAFDNDASGISSGEGVCTLLLKSLDKAILDGDNIRAIIKGSAVNHDGNSIGLTAPNDEAQKEVITEAWKASQVNPESIAHIESHGTGTKLGDPVEIRGIEKAFRNYTNKIGFCSIGSNKPNIGHLDNAAGIASIMKVLMMIQHKEIPPIINFKRPNNKINFISSPIYINDKLTKWESKGELFRCGVSSFGLSGTNCHMILSEYTDESPKRIRNNNKMYIFTLSAREDYILRDLAEQYIKSIDEKMDIVDICYTTNVGRMHNNYRLAFTVSDVDQLKMKLREFLDDNRDLNSDYFYGFSKLVSSKKKKLDIYELNNIEKNKIDDRAYNLINDVIKSNDKSMLEEICKLYVKGAEILWYKIYVNESTRKVSLPVYPFKRDRCWVDNKKNLTSLKNGHKNSLIKGNKIISIGQTIYESKFTPVNDWVIGDHIINNRYVMPGTAYIEMITEILKDIGVTSSIGFKNTMFINQFSMNYEESKNLQIIVKEKDDGYEFIIASLEEIESKWNIHSEGSVFKIDEPDSNNIDMHKIHSYMTKDNLIEINDKDSLVKLEGRWKGIKKEIYKTNDGYLAHIELSYEHIDDLEMYYFHPALLDRAINATIDIIDNDEYYLPLNYNDLKMYRSIPRSFYSLITEKNRNSNETANFHVKLFDLQGSIFGEAKDYSVKKARKITLENSRYNNMLFYTEWEKLKEKEISSNCINGGIALIRTNISEKLRFIDDLRNNEDIYEIELGVKYAFAYDFFDRVGMQDYSSIIEYIKENNIKNIVYLGTHESEEDLQRIFLLTKEIINKKMLKEIKMLYIAENVVDMSEKQINITPLNNAVSSLFNVIHQEYEEFGCRCLNVCEEITADIIIDELKKSWKKTVVVYKNCEYYNKVLKEYNNFSEETENYKLYTEGAYIISGGSGGLALEIAKHLASKNKLNIILISRTNITDSFNLDETLKCNQKCKKQRTLDYISEIEKNGSKVNFYSCDVTDRVNLDNVIKSVRSSFGRINGIIHCAGIAGDGFLFRKSEEDFNSVINPKIKGTINLDLLTREDKPDFMVLFSSINSLIGGKGQGDYSAANAFMDEYSVFRTKLGLNTLAINWSAWEEIGMAYEHSSYRKDDLFKSLQIKDALNLFDIALRSKMSNLVIGELNDKFFEHENQEKLSFDIEKSIKEKIKNKISKNNMIKQNSYNKPVIISGNDEELNEVEKNLASIWGNILKVNELNIYDSFSSLGGDSILATYLYKDLEKKYPGLLDITDIFIYSSIYEMAEYINEKLKEDNHENVIEKQVDDLDNLLEMLANGEIDVSEINNILR